jgi:transposase
MAQYYTGLDVSLESTNIAIVNERGKLVFESSASTDPQSINTTLLKAGFPIQKASLESGSWSHWLIKELSALGWNITCIDARSISPLLALNTNKTDRNDARGIAEAVRIESQYIKEVYQKSQSSIDMQTLLSARRLFVTQKTALSNSIRGLLRVYGLRLPAKKGHSLTDIIQKIIQENWPHQAVDSDRTPPILALEALACTFEKVSKEITSIDNFLYGFAKKNDLTKRFMTVPGIGPVTAITYQVVIDNPDRFKNSRLVGSYLGMCPRQYSSGQTKKMGRISKRGNKELRNLLSSAGLIVLHRCKKEFPLRTWGLKIADKHGVKKASVAVGRKITIILHQIWSKNTVFLTEKS